MPVAIGSAPRLAGETPCLSHRAAEIEKSAARSGSARLGLAHLPLGDSSPAGDDLAFGNANETQKATNSLTLLRKLPGVARHGVAVGAHIRL